MCVPSLKEPVLSRAVSADFVAWECLCFLCIRGRSAPSAETDSSSVRSCLSARSAVACSACVLRLVTVLRIHLRGLFGRSFQRATVPLPVPSWTPADRMVRPRSGMIRPTPIKSVRSSCGTPGRSIIRNTPGRKGQVQGTHRAGKEPQGSARLQAANQHCHKSRMVSPIL